MSSFIAVGLAKSDLSKQGRENWVRDDRWTHCSMCATEFGMLVRKHHCRACGNIFCWKCSNKEISFTPYTRKSETGYSEKTKRVCDACYRDIQEDKRRSVEDKKKAELERREALTEQDEIRRSVILSLDRVAELQVTFQERQGHAELDEVIQYFRQYKWQFAVAPGEEDHPHHAAAAAATPRNSNGDGWKQFVYHDHTSDIMVHFEGATQTRGYAHVCLGMFQYMTELIRRCVEVEGTSHELEEFLSTFSYEIHISRQMRIEEFLEGKLRIHAMFFPESTTNTMHIMKGAREVKELFPPQQQQEQQQQQREHQHHQQQQHQQQQQQQARGSSQQVNGGDGHSSTAADHVADIRVHTQGKTRAEAFALVCVGMFQYMTGYDPIKLRSIQLDGSGHNLNDRLYHLVDEFLYIFGVEMHISRRAGERKEEKKKRFTMGALGELGHALQRRHEELEGLLGRQRAPAKSLQQKLLDSACRGGEEPGQRASPLSPGTGAAASADSAWMFKPSVGTWLIRPLGAHQASAAHP